MLGHKLRGAYSDNFAYEPTTRRERTVAAAIAIALSLGLAVLAAFSREAGPTLLGFVPADEAVIVSSGLFTAWMLFSQYRIHRHSPLAILAFAYALFGVLHLGYLLTFPGTFVASGVLGIGLQTAPWIFAAGHFAFACLVLGFVFVERSRRRNARWHAGIVARAGAASFGFLAVLALAVTAAQRWLPWLVNPNGVYTGLDTYVVTPVDALLLLAAASAVVATCGIERRIHLWLAVVLYAMGLEGLCSAFSGGARFTVGWYVSHTDAALSSALFFCVMQAQLASILRRATRDGERAVALHHIVSLGNESSNDRNAAMLERVAIDLDFDWACIAQLDRGWIRLETSVGESPYPIGYRAPAGEAWIRDANKRRDLVVHQAEDDVPWIDETPTIFRDWTTFVTVPIFVDDHLYGLAGFANASPRKAPLSDADRSFLQLLGLIAGVTIERFRQRRQLNALAYHDALTGLPNRAALFEQLHKEVALAQRYDRQFAVHFLDLDGFKAVNDSLGHAAGDEVLREVSRRLSVVVRESDTVARLGGDEFVVLQPHVDDIKAPDRLANRLRGAFVEPFPVGDRVFKIGTSIGTSRFPRDGSEIHALIDRADAALYRQKAKRRKSTADEGNVTVLKPRN